MIGPVFSRWRPRTHTRRSGRCSAQRGLDAVLWETYTALGKFVPPEMEIVNMMTSGKIIGNFISQICNWKKDV